MFTDLNLHDAAPSQHQINAPEGYIVLIDRTMQGGVQRDQENNIRTSGVKIICTRMVFTAVCGFQWSRYGLRIYVGQKR